MNHDKLLQLSRQLSPADVCAQLLALCVVEYSYTPSLKITLELGDAEGKLTDTGRGMRLTPDFACRSLKFTSMRDGEVWSQSYRYGTPSGPAVKLGSTEINGTVIDFETTEPINHAVVGRFVEALRSRIQGLSIDLRSHGRSQ